MTANRPAAPDERLDLAAPARSWLVPLIGSVCAVGLLVWLYADLDLDRFGAALRGAEPRWLVVLGAAVLLEQLLSGWKWRQILLDLKPIASLRLCGAILAGYAASILLPLGISPLVRSWLVARRERLPMASVLASAATERFVDGLVFALLVGLVALAGPTPLLAGEARGLLAAAGALVLVLFGALLLAVLTLRSPSGSGAGRMLERLAALGGRPLAGLRAGIAGGLVWPRQPGRQLGVIAASVAMRAVATSHLLWAGWAVGVRLQPLDYLFLMVLAGGALVLARALRVPGGFVIGAALALAILGVPDAQAVAMIVLHHAVSIALVVGIGMAVLWQSGISLSLARRVGRRPRGAA
jgi:uncharacterized membrane protein YbhN (UPF0104 family)